MTPAAYLRRSQTGSGAALRGGRWNTKDMPAVYASLDAATTVLETLATFDPENAPDIRFRLLQL